MNSTLGTKTWSVTIAVDMMCVAIKAKPIMYAIIVNMVLEMASGIKIIGDNLDF